MNTEFELATKAFAARNVTGRLPNELMDEGIPLSNAWADAPELEHLVSAYPVVSSHFPNGSTITGMDDFWVFPEGSASVQEPTTSWPSVYKDPSILTLWEWVALTTVDQLATKLRTDVYERLHERLAVLLDSDEWEEGETMPSWPSFYSLLEFLIQHPDFGCPYIGLLRSGRFELSWHMAQDRLVVLAFDAAAANWLVFAPPQPGSNHKERAQGTCAVELIVARLQVYGALEWMARAE